MRRKFLQQFSRLRMLLPILFVFVLAPAVSAQETREPTPLVLAKATLIDGTGAAPRPNVTLVVENGTISSISDDTAATPPPGSSVVDLSGHFILPGLVDAHVHLSSNPNPEATLRDLLYAGVTAVRDMGGDARTLAVLARDARIGAIQAPDIYYSAVLFGPPWLQDPRSRFSAPGMKPGLAPWSRVVTEDSDLPQIMAEARGTGATGVKIYSAVAPDLLQRIADEAHSQGLRVWSHATVYPSKPSDAVAAGVDVLSHAGGLYPEARADIPSSYTEAITRWLPTQDFAEVDPHAPPFDALFDAMAQRGTLLEPTVSAGRRPRADSGLEGQLEHLAEAAQRIDMASLRAWACAASRIAHEVGVAIVAGTDSNGAVHVGVEMARLVECGIPPLHVIRAATLNGARALGVEATHGSVEVGKIADLVILAADPVADIGDVRRVAAVVKGGRMYEPEGGTE